MRAALIVFLWLMCGITSYLILKADHMAACSKHFVSWLDKGNAICWTTGDRAVTVITVAILGPVGLILGSVSYVLDNTNWETPASW